MAPPELTPHGRLIEAARGSLSKRQAAARAGISEGRWRQIVTGIQRAGPGLTIPVNPRAETLVAMANAVGADPADVLDAAGLPSDAVRGLQRQVEARPLIRYTNRELLLELERRLRASEDDEDYRQESDPRGDTAPTITAGGAPAGRGLTPEQEEWDRHANALRDDPIHPLGEKQIVATLGPRPTSPTGEIPAVTEHNTAGRKRA